MTPRLTREACQSLAALFEYPGADYHGKAERAAATLPGELREPMEAFAGSLSGWDLARLEEAYIRMFDLNPDCTLDIGWHLFGEDYARGEFLVKLKAEHRKHGTEDPAELADHLPAVLRLLGEMPEEEAAQFTKSFLAPAMKKIRTNAKDESPYAGLLQALVAHLEDEVLTHAEEAVHE